MPIYEFRCRSCGTRFSQFFRSRDVSTTPPCERCGAEADRLISASVHVRGEKALLDNLDRRDLIGRATGSGGVPSEKQFAAWARDMHERVGDTLGTDYQALADKAEAGENPIERLDVAHHLNYEVSRRSSELGGAPSAPPPSDPLTS